MLHNYEELVGKNQSDRSAGAPGWSREHLFLLAKGRWELPGLLWLVWLVPTLILTEPAVECLEAGTSPGGGVGAEAAAEPPCLVGGAGRSVKLLAGREQLFHSRF